MGQTAPLLLLLLASCASQVIKDESRSVSIIQLPDGDLEVSGPAADPPPPTPGQVVPGQRLNSGAVAWASLTNAQAVTGWQQLEVSSSPAFPDQVQARAAGQHAAVICASTEQIETFQQMR